MKCKIRIWLYFCKSFTIGKVPCCLMTNLEYVNGQFQFLFFFTLRVTKYELLNIVLSLYNIITKYGFQMAYGTKSIQIWKMQKFVLIENFRKKIKTRKLFCVTVKHLMLINYNWNIYIGVCVIWTPSWPIGWYGSYLSTFA